MDVSYFNIFVNFLFIYLSYQDATLIMDIVNHFPVVLMTATPDSAHSKKKVNSLTKPLGM